MTFAAAALTSSAVHTWRTPPAVLDVVRKMGGIALDPCASADPAYHFADVNITETEDGLEASWHLSAPLPAAWAVRTVFCNPPYGRALLAWMRKCRMARGCSLEVIGLVPARTETAWFEECWKADAICFWRRRIKFLDVELKDGRPRSTSAPFPSALPYWGPRADLFEQVFEAAGQVVRL